MTARNPTEEVESKLHKFDTISVKMLEAVVAVITKGDKVLLIQRAPSVRGAGYWAPVSGLRTTER